MTIDNRGCYNTTHRYYLSGKRFFDLLVAVGLLFFALPLVLLISLAIKITYGGAVIFKQKRLGEKGKPFTMYKFRSMVSNADQLKTELAVFNMSNGPAFKMRDDPRITKFGKFLRRTSLDEIPQLWNVIKGQMSMVGPRPLIVSEVIKDAYPQFLLRLSVRPGLTCLWQVKGRSNIVDFNQWLKLDLDYIEKRSFLFDIKLLLKTIPAVIFGLGAL